MAMYDKMVAGGEYTIGWCNPVATEDLRIGCMELQLMGFVVLQSIEGELYEVPDISDLSQLAEIIVSTVSRGSNDGLAPFYWHWARYSRDLTEELWVLSLDMYFESWRARRGSRGI